MVLELASYSILQGDKPFSCYKTIKQEKDIGM